MTLTELATSILKQSRKRMSYNNIVNGDFSMSLLLTPKQFSWMKSLFYKELAEQFPTGNPLGYISINRRMWKLKSCGGKACVPGIGWRTGDYGMLFISPKL